MSLTCLSPQKFIQKHLLEHAFSSESSPQSFSPSHVNERGTHFLLAHLNCFIEQVSETKEK